MRAKKLEKEPSYQCPSPPRPASGASYESMIPPGALDPPPKFVKGLVLEDGPGAPWHMIKNNKAIVPYTKMVGKMEQVR